MRMRMGFVSNSSSTSFCIYGARLDEGKVRGALGVEGDDEYIVDIVGKAAERLGLNLEVESPCDCGAVYIGRSWRTVGLEETGKQFRESVEAALKQLFPGEDLVFKTLEEAWRDG